jgi:predicted nucleic acid-binding protein
VGIELRRLAFRRGRVAAAEHLLRGVELIPVDEAVLQAAEIIEPANVATLDAIHLATARRLHTDNLLDAVMTFDARLAEGARHYGITVVTPD